jgi:hypothetical protein
MPVKRRNGKRRVDDVAMLAAWEQVFQCGYDFFDEAGWGHREHTPEFRPAAQEAWARYGRRYLDTWQPTDVRDEPWALEEFGEPDAR